MALRRVLPKWTLTLVGLAAGVALATVFVFQTNSETVLRNSFSTALGATTTTPRQVAKSAPISGSEDFWLTADRTGGSLAVTKAVSVGDRIALTLGGQNRQLEVASVSEYAPKTTEIDTRSNQSHFVLVTARDTASKDVRAIRFIMEIEQKPAPGIGVQARAL